MPVFYLSIGSNIHPHENIPRCLDVLKKELRVSKVSTIYETNPVDPSGNQKFWNLAVSVEFPGQVNELAQKIRAIEESLGRKRDPQNKFAARVIDIDILPQQDYQRQAFIMIPLAEIAPGEKDPETNKSFFDLAAPLQKEISNFKIVGKN